MARACVDRVSTDKTPLAGQGVRHERWGVGREQRGNKELYPYGIATASVALDVLEAFRRGERLPLGQLAYIIEQDKLASRIQCSH